MGSSSPTNANRASFPEVFRAQAGPADILRFDRFMKLALYHPAVGYYCSDRPRVGYGPGTDFFTATTSGAIFGELIIAACRSLLPAGELAKHTFVEIGAEPGQGIIKALPHPFAGARSIVHGDPIELTGDCIVFSNELFDAQPFRRFVGRDGRWDEVYVALRDGQFVEITGQADPLPPELPAEVTEGYFIDAPLASVQLLRRIAAQPWRGLFIACDYGKSWAELLEATPTGTARAFHAHVQGNDLLARPGEQDLTCHVCWDWLVAALAESGFQQPRVDSHESFFIRQASEFVSTVVQEEAARFSPRKMSLMQLLHPAHLGQKFQVLHACRP
jgi:SAM-dependent MidA family methyltransferase